MPNFIAKKLRNLGFPHEKNGVKFQKIYKGRKLDLLLCENLGEKFFLTIKPKGDEFVIKGEKISRPAKVGLLQSALEAFHDEFCEEIKSEAFGVNKNSLTSQESPIKGENEILELINSAKFGEIHIEIGFGSGRHILHLANSNPNALFIGIEIYKPAMEQVAKLAIAGNLQNIALLNCDARTFFDMIDSNLVDFIYLHFPVPWDDAEHRRVVSDEFMEVCARILKVGGIFELRSDSQNYTNFTIQKMLNLAKADIKIVKNRDLEIVSKYEARWRRQEKDIFEVRFKNQNESEKLNLEFDFSFNKFNFAKITRNFRNETLKFDDFFVHFEDIFLGENEVMIKVSFGAFNSPENHYILVTPETCGYFFRAPLKTSANLKAHNKIKEIWAND